ncbi:MAG: hypothetical protein L6Q78_02775 [Bacteroidia bacterium]|nr:hypothetical protein [Bacteroidia bacterium]
MHFKNFIGIASLVFAGFNCVFASGIQGSEPVSGNNRLLFGPQIPQQKQQLLKSEKGKPVLYNSLGVGIPTNSSDLNNFMGTLTLGGNHISYRKWGVGISWRVGLGDILSNRDKAISSVSYQNAKDNGWFTGNPITQYLYSANFNLVLPITKKIPFYVGTGPTRVKVFEATRPVWLNPSDPDEFVLNEEKTGFKLNWGAGVFVPITSRVILNLGYDHLPQRVFVGIAISSPYNWEDIDLW